MRLIGLVLALSLALAPLAAEAQQAVRIYRVGLLLGGPVSAVEAHVQAFRDRLRESGYVEGQNLALEVRWMTTAESDLDRLAADLVRLKTEALVTYTSNATFASRGATSTIPIVMVSVGDPVGAGLVARLARPGGNVTGVSNVSLDMIGKQLQLLTELRPGVIRIAVLWDPTNNPRAAGLYRREFQTAAQSLGVQHHILYARDPRELEAAFAAMGREHVRPLRPYHSVVPCGAPSGCRACPGGGTPDHVRPKGECRSGWPRLVRAEADRTVPAGRHLSRQNPEGRQACRSAGRATHEIRAGHQSQDGEGTRPHHPAIGATAGGSGDPIAHPRPKAEIG